LPDPVSPPLTPKTHTVPASRAGERLDRYLAEAERSLSRSAVQQLIDAGHVRVNDAPARASRRVRQGDRIEVVRPRRAPQALVPEEIPLEIVYEDEALAVLLKPAGMVVHPAVGHRSGTLVHALLHRYGTLPDGSGAPERAGIVHRLDKGTSGVMVVARTDGAHRELARQLEAREVKRVYRALVWGQPRDREGRIEAPLGRSARDRKKFAVVTRGGRFAATRFKVVRSFSYVSELLLRLETGRTHQIRVHLAHEGHPVFGDPEYGGRRGPLQKLPPASRARAAMLLSDMDHQALHAETIAFTHPVTGVPLEFTRPVPPDFAAVLRALECES
jgi:23S rRNA pseudouridine1911/1915/1917 synthase